jgi:hypothetical protein
VGERGPKHVSERDWIFGSRPRRLALVTILAPGPARQEWSRAALADAAEVTLRGIDGHLDGFCRLGLIEQTDTGYRRTNPMPPLARDLRRVLAHLEAVAADQTPRQ